MAPEESGGRCLACRSDGVEVLLDLGPQPICNRFLSDPAQVEYTHPAVLGVCGACGTAQLVDPVPAEELRPLVDWITYNEPEAHLDDLARLLAGSPELTFDRSRVAGVSFKDDSLLARLERLGLPVAFRIDTSTDLGVPGQGAGVETVAARLTAEAAGSVADRCGLVDLLVARHVLEHAEDPAAFIAGCVGLLEPGGLLMLEVPDCTRAFDSFDYTTLWEEHPFYFSDVTYRAVLERNGLEILVMRRYPYPFEDSMVALARVARNSPAGELIVRDDAGIQRAERFAASFETRRAQHRRSIEAYRSHGRHVAMFGAGHLACTYVDFFEFADIVDLVVDDDSNKTGLWMPGSHIPILPSAELRAEDVALCLMTLSPESEARVVAARAEYERAGGVLASILPSSPRALVKEV